MSIGLLLIADGRHEYHARSCRSVVEYLPKFDQYIYVDDPDHRLGFAGAIQQGWDQVQTDYLVHWEADFTVDRDVPVDDMVAVLEAQPHLVQMALLRQPVNERETAAGGIVAMDPELYEPQECLGHRFLVHRRNVTTNPSVWPRWVIDRGWPQRRESEGHFGIELFAESPELRAAYWGDGSEWVRHIGDVRSGRGY